MKGEFHLYAESPVEDSSYSIAEDRLVGLNVSYREQMSYNNHQVKC